MKTIPDPGSDGTYAETCFICLRGRDTGFAFTGVPEVATTGMMALGIESATAQAAIAAQFGNPTDEIPNRVITVALRVCESCAAPTPFDVSLVATGVPDYRYSA